RQQNLRGSTDHRHTHGFLPLMMARRRTLWTGIFALLTAGECCLFPGNLLPSSGELCSAGG
ncbi:hypothetical protein KUCAC02_033915, partial [Chaenocephalus aceratus]